MVSHPEEASLTRAMLRRARRRVLLADHTKCGTGGYFAYGTLARLQSLDHHSGHRPGSFLRHYRAMVEIKEAS